MFSWIGVDEVTPTGLRLNRAWHARQLMMIVAVPVLAMILTEHLFGSKYRHILQQRRIFYDKMKDEDFVKEQFHNMKIDRWNPGDDDIYFKRIKFIANRDDLKKQWDDIRRLNRQYYVIMMESHYHRYVLKNRSKHDDEHRMKISKQATKQDD